MGNASIEQSAKLTPNVCMVRRVVVYTAILTYLCHIDLRSSDSIFDAFLSDACVRSSVPFVYEGFVVACCKVVPRTAATFFVT